MTTKTIKVADFGLARLAEGESELTAIGARLGTPRYMSPEILRGEPSSFVSDIYALGVILYEMLAARPAFRAENVVALSRLIIDEPFPDVSAYVPDTPSELAHIISRATRKEPAQRYQSARDLYEDFCNFLSRSAESASGAAAFLDEAESLTDDSFFIPPLNDETQEDAVSGFSGGAPGITIESRSSTKTDFDSSSGVAAGRKSSLDFIVHHADAENEWAEWISIQLMNFGYEVRIEPWNGQNPHESLRQLIKAARRKTIILSVLSPSYLRAVHGNAEWVDAITTRQLKPLLVMAAKCNLSSLFRTVSYIDLIKLNQDKVRELLFEEAVELRGKPHALRRDAIAAFKENLAPKELDHTIWNVAHDPDSMFFGRGTLLTDIYQTLYKKGKIATLIPPSEKEVGTGKSRLALEYTQINRSNYSVIWWMRASQKAVLQEQYAALANELDLPEKGAVHISPRVEAVRAWLSGTQNWLLIFEDAKRWADIAEYIPENRSGHVLIISRSPKWSKSMNPIVVPRLDRGESTDWLFQSTGVRNDGATAALASSLSDNAMALQLATDYLNHAKATYDEYIDMQFQRHRLFWGRGDPPRHGKAVITTSLSLSVERAYREAPGSIDLLKACAYLGPAGIRLADLVVCAKLFPRPLAKILSKPQKLREAVRVLGRYGLAEEKDEVIRVPETIQDTMALWIELRPKEELSERLEPMLRVIQQTRAEEKSPHLWLLAMVAALKELFRSDYPDEDSLRDSTQLLPHAIFVAVHSEHCGINPKISFELWSRLGNYLYLRGDRERSISAYKKAIALYAQGFGKGHKGLDVHYKKLANVYRAKGDQRRACAEYERALEIETRTLGKRHKKVAASLQHLGNVCMDMRDHAAARQYYNRALAINEKNHGARSAEVCRDYSNLALVSQELKDFTQAWENFNRALQIAEKIYDKNHPMIAYILRHEAGLLQTMGDLSSARKYYNRVIGLDIEHHGESHPHVAQDFNNLGLVQQSLGDFTDAYKNYAKALAINEKLFGHNHPKVGINLVNVGNIQRMERSLDSAARSYERAVQIFNEVFGKNHQHTLSAQKNLDRLRAEMKAT